MRIPCRLEGWARKIFNLPVFVFLLVALPLLWISAIGWIVWLVGFSLLYHHTGSIRGATLFAPYWVFLVSGPLTYILSILYLLTGIPLLGLPTHVFTTLSIATCGMILYDSGLYFMLRDSSCELNEQARRISTCTYSETVFAGSLIAELFLGISVLLWPFFIVKPPEFCINLTKDDRQAFSGLHLHAQPDGSFQQAMFTQLAPPQGSTDTDISSLQQKLNSLESLMRAMAECQGIPGEGKPDHNSS